MDIPEETRIDIVKNLLNERYSAEHKMRERSAKFTIWILGVGVAFLWVLLKKDSLDFSQKLIIFAFILSYSIISIWFLEEICKGFKTNRRIIIKLEDYLGLYTEGAYIQKDTILPENYMQNYDRMIPSHFKSLYALIIILGIFILALVLITPCTSVRNETNGKNIQTHSLEVPKTNLRTKKGGS